MDAPVQFTSAARSRRLRDRKEMHGKGVYANGRSCCWHNRRSLIRAAPAGKHVAWAYCHVPNGSAADASGAIEEQIERFAPGFRARILARHVIPAVAMEQHNANLIGGDIGGGAETLAQVFLRPTRRLYRTTAKGVYLCSSSTPPGGGVHGMCGYSAARAALRDGF